MAEPVRARRLSEDEGRRLQQIVRRGKHGSVRVRRALIIMASASGTPVPAIARLVAADEDTVRDVIHAFNDRGLHALDPQWAGGRPRLINDEDITFIVATATARPKTLGLPFTRWSVRKLGAYLSGSYQYVEPGLGLQRMPGPAGADRPGTAAPGAARQRHHLSADCSTTGPGKSPRIRISTPSWTGSSTWPAPSRTGASRLTSSGRCRSAPTTDLAGPAPARRTGCRRPTGAPTASATSTAATASPMTSCGGWCAPVRAATTPWPR